jgi:hypothetical protein
MIMGAIITDYTLKSYIRQIVRDTTNRNTVISRLWEWIYHPNIRDPLPEVDTDSLLELLVTEFGSEAVKDRGTVDDIQRHEIIMQNITFHLVRLPGRYMVSAGMPAKSVSFSKYRNPEETVEYMRAFNDAMPTIHMYIDENIAAKERAKLLSNITEATGRGMIEQIKEEEGLEIPKISCIRGTDKGRVIIYFDEIDEKINCPIDYLRARLIRRFANKRRK